MIEVLEPGFATTVQDEGRHGHYKSGVAPSGAMDLMSYRLGNGLLGNAPGTASLEMTFTGPRLRFDRELAFAVTGGDLPVYLNGEEQPRWTVLTAKPDDVVHFGFLRSGVRAYLAIQGGVGVPVYLGSRSTHVLCKLGGYKGRPLAPGDVLEAGSAGTAHPKATTLDSRFIPQHTRDAELRYVPGLFDYRLTDAGRRQFTETEWAVSPDADRTGVRMTSKAAEPLEFVPREPPFGTGHDPSNVADAGYPIGSIQIPSGTVPIVMARDGVTAGGYFTLGAVITADLDRLGQTPTHGRIRFTPVSLESALTIRRERARMTAEALSSLR